MKKWISIMMIMTMLSCAHNSAPISFKEDKSEYLIGKEDLLEISVWRDADLSRTIPVRPDGRISLPLLGEMEVAGKSPQTVAQEIRTKLKPWVEEPHVAVIVREVNAPRYYVIGEVARPGGYPLRGKTTILQALSVAGGPNEFASRSSIMILRNQKEKIPIDYSDLVENSDHDVCLKPGDTIYVP
jgi:polysaccharide export outer membrane protein